VRRWLVSKAEDRGPSFKMRTRRRAVRDGPIAGVIAVRTRTFGLRGAGAAMLTAVIFVCDTFSRLEFAVAVMYVGVISIVALYNSRRCIVGVSVICAGLTIASYLCTHGLDLSDTAPVRSAVSLAAICLVSGLSLKQHSANALLRKAERERSNLARFFSPQRTERIIAADVPFSIATRRPAAVLFVDMIGFTTFCAKAPPETVIATLREFLAILSESVFAYNGTIDKFLGDGLLAVFGSHNTDSTDATNAVACALDMIRATDEWNARTARTGGELVRVAIGIHYGDVIQGDVGSDRQLEFTVVGDTVNVASRVESYCRQLQTTLLVTDALMGLLRSEGALHLACDLTDRGKHRLRGRSEETQLFGISAK
jgi:class 3 adenylate cyclase